MKLHSPAFERELKRHCKSAIRSSPELKREYRRLKRHFRRRHNILKAVRPFVSVILGLIVFFMAQHSGRAAAALAFIAVAAFLFASYRAFNLLQQLFTAPDLPALRMLPISEQQIFRWEFQRFIRRSVWSLVDILGAFGGLVLYYNFSLPQQFAAVLIAAVVWVTIVALAALGAAYFPGLPYGTGAAVVGAILWFAVVIDAFRAQVLAFLDASAGVIMMVLPTGWPVSLFHMLIPPVDWLYLVLIVPSLLLIASLRFAVVRLRRSYEFYESVVRETPTAVPESNEEDDVNHRTAETSGETGATAIEELVVTRKFLEAPDWHARGWFERILWSWFTERERTVAEFAFVEGIEITKPWKKILISILVTSLVSGGISIVLPFAALWVVGLGFFFVFCQIMTQLGGTRNFLTVPSSGVLMPLYCAYPVGYFELGGMLIKRAAVQIPWLFAVPIMASLIAAYVAHLPMQGAIIVGVKVGGVLFAATFILAMLGFSGGTNDTHVRLRTLPLLVAMVLGVLVGLGLAIGAAFSFRLGGWICWLLLILDAYALFGIYGYFYNKKTFDLMRMPRGA
jgi:hypothetical protein